MKLFHRIRHFLVPHQSNNHKAKILHPSTLTVIVSLFLIYQFGINFALLVQPSILGFATDISPEKVIELTNQERLKNGLNPLRVSQTLNQAAQMKAGDMFAFNYWAHNSPSGRTPWDFIKQAGYHYLYAGENLARDFMNSDAVVQAWMASPSHKENIINDKYQEIGLAVVNGTIEGVETTLVVQMFGTPTPTPASTASVPPTQLLSEPSKTVAIKLTPTPVLPVGKESLNQPVLSPTPIPTISSLAVNQKSPSIILAQARNERNSPPLLSPFFLTKTVAIFLLGMIMGALVIDALLVYKHKVVRLSSKNIAHLIFIATLLLAVILTTPGAII